MLAAPLKTLTRDEVNFEDDEQSKENYAKLKQAIVNIVHVKGNDLIIQCCRHFETRAFQ